MLAKMNVPASSEVELIAATLEAARGDGKEEWIRIPVRYSTCPIPAPE